ADGLWRVEHVLADLRSDRLHAVRQLGKPQPNYRKITFHKEHLDQEQHLDAVLVGPGHPLYAAVDEKLNEMLRPVVGASTFYVDAAAEAPYRLHFFEITVKGQNSKGLAQALHGELVAVREELGSTSNRFSVIPADFLIDLPALAEAPEATKPIDPSQAADFLKSTYQTERRRACQEERQHFVEVCRDYLTKSFAARIRASQDRVMALRAREAASPEVALARQRAENDLADLKRTEKERMLGLDTLAIDRHGPVRHVASATVVPATEAIGEALAELLEELDPEVKRRCELAAEEVVIAYEKDRGWETERVGHLKIGFDVRSLGPVHPETGFRDPVGGVRRIEVKGRSKGKHIRLTTNEWYKATQLGDTYWLYVVWNPLDKPDSTPLMIQNPAKYLDHAKKEIVAARYFDIPAQAITAVAQNKENY